MASHPDRTWDRRLWEPIIFTYRGETTLFHKCCGKGWYDRSNVCTQIAKGMHHPGKLEVTILPGSRVRPGATKSLQWSCCGTKVFTQSAIGRTPHSRAPGCTPLDLTLRDDGDAGRARLAAVVARPPTPLAARRVPYSRGTYSAPGGSTPWAAGCASSPACSEQGSAGRRRTCARTTPNRTLSLWPTPNPRCNY